VQRLLDILISGSHQRLLVWSLWSAIFVVLLATASVFALGHARSVMLDDAREDALRLNNVRRNVEAGFHLLDTHVKAAPCSEEFLQQMRRVAFEPDGLNEFIYAPAERPQCSTSQVIFEKEIDLGPADITGEKRLGASIWLDRNLDVLGIPGLRGTIVHRDPFAIVVPPQELGSAHSGWVHKELVLVDANNVRWTRAGETDVFDRALSGSSLGVLRGIICDKVGLFCVAAEASLSDLVREWFSYIAGGIGLVALLAAWLASRGRAWLAQYWSLEERFCRYLTRESVVCVYQPIMDIKTGAIVGCEVLARWRDVNGHIVYPDSFIGIVERSKLTKKFTRMVVQNAARDLREHLPEETHLQVNFNVFPCDFDSQWLLDTFSALDNTSGRFDLVVEIIESDAVPLDTAQRDIEALYRAGVKTYIDDFGVGYSNIQNLASLAVTGVKLDRSFAMAPENSMMSKMLLPALDMVVTTGRSLVVEGVETEERFALLKAHGKVDFVQGYLISRPLSIDAFAAFLKTHDPAHWAGIPAA
jgi:sensor c-di-GMP phosphodiesterase-like protein